MAETGIIPTMRGQTDETGGRDEKNWKEKIKLDQENK